MPEDIRWIPATTQGRVERIVLRPGAEVKPDTVILELSNPDLQQSVKDAQLASSRRKRPSQNRKAELAEPAAQPAAGRATIEAQTTARPSSTSRPTKQLDKDGAGLRADR